MENKSLGFTLIELLVVVAILGILAVGVITLINPAEKAKEASDTANKNTAAEISSAFDRWLLDGGSFGAHTVFGSTTPSFSLEVADTLTTGGYLKSGVANSDLFTKTSVGGTLITTTNSAKVCFVVQSTKYRTAWGASTINGTENMICQ